MKRSSIFKYRTINNKKIKGTKADIIFQFVIDNVKAKYFNNSYLRQFVFVVREPNKQFDNSFITMYA